MDENTQGLLLLGALAIASAIGWHLYITRFITAIFASVFTTVVLLQIINFIYLGYVEPFFLIAMLTSGVIAAFISSIIGLVFMLKRKTQKPNKAFKTD